MTRSSAGGMAALLDAEAAKQTRRREGLGGPTERRAAGGRMEGRIGLLTQS